MFTSPRLFRFICALIAALILFSVDSPAQDPKIPFSLPGDLVKIESVYRADRPSNVWVIHIQDAHCVVEAQRNIHRLLDYLQAHYGLKHVYLEGGEGKLDASHLRRFPDLKVKREVLEKYLARGEISGAEYAAVMNANESAYFGIENQALYDLNRGLLLEVDRTRPVRERILSEIRKCPEVDLLARASRLDLERKDYGKFKELYRDLVQNGPAFFDALGISPQSEEWIDLAKLFEPVMKFYEIVIQRDQAMSANVLRRIREDKPQIAVLVTGGFHADGIGKLLSQKGISTLVVTPHFKDWTGKENYLPVMSRGLACQALGTAGRAPTKAR